MAPADIRRCLIYTILNHVIFTLQGSAYGLKEGPELLQGISPLNGYYPYDPTMIYPYMNGWVEVLFVLFYHQFPTLPASVVFTVRLFDIGLDCWPRFIVVSRERKLYFEWAMIWLVSIGEGSRCENSHHSHQPAIIWVIHTRLTPSSHSEIIIKNRKVEWLLSRVYG